MAAGMTIADMSSLTALVLAGNRPGGDPFAQGQGVAHKGLLTVGGAPILCRVVGSLRRAGIGRIVVATNCEKVGRLARQLDAEVAPASAGPSASVGAVLDSYGTPLLVTTADHAMLRARWVTDFVRDTPECDLSILLARREVVERDVPNTARTWMKLADGQWSGCNLFLLRTPECARAIDLWSEVEANRKRPLRMAGKLGWGTLMRFVLGRLTLQDMVSRLAGQVDLDARVVAAHDGRAAVDVDKDSDLDLVRRLVAEQGREVAA